MGGSVARQQGASDRPDGTEKTLEAKHVVLASGSVPVQLRNVPHTTANTSSTRECLGGRCSARTLGVIGAGVIGLELGSVWRRLDSE